MPPFIVTLGMMMIVKGAAYLISENISMSRFPDSFRIIGQGFFYPVIITAAVSITLAFLLSKTKFGFNAFAIGGNRKVAGLYGVPVKFYQVLYYSVGGLLTALASIILTARLNFATANRGESWELQSIAAAVLGGTSLFGGMGGVGRTLTGVLIMRSLETGLIHLGVSSYWQSIAIGLVLIFAVWIDHIQRKENI